jgi:2-polyprenyl-3-methyl-5-hydroxy-6-metoxy-1,4-benzoquinol methylase
VQFKRVIYENFVKRYKEPLYGQQSIQRIQGNFAMWRHHFGRVLPSDKEASILDIGCGDGGFVLFLQTEGFRRAGGIDVSPEQIETGRSMGIDNIECIDFRDHLPGKVEVYDCIVARDVLEHFTRQEIFDILALVHGALRPGGRFIAQVPNGEGIFHASILYGDFTHEIAFTRSSLQQVCQNTGFGRLDCYPAGPAPKDALSAVRWLLWQLIVLKTRVYKLVETGSGRGIFTQNLIARAMRD